MDDTHGAAPDRPVRTPAAAGRDEQQHEQEQQVVGALGDVLDAEAGGRDHPARPGAAVGLDGELAGVEAEHPHGLGVARDHPALDVGAHRGERLVGEEILDDDGVAELEVGDGSAGLRLDPQRQDEVVGPVDPPYRRACERDGPRPAVLPGGGDVLGGVGLERRALRPGRLAGVIGRSRATASRSSGSWISPVTASSPTSRRIADALMGCARAGVARTPASAVTARRARRGGARGAQAAPSSSVWSRKTV